MKKLIIKPVIGIVFALGMSQSFASAPIEELKYARALINEVYQSQNISNKDASTLKLALEKLDNATQGLPKRKPNPESNSFLSKTANVCVPTPDHSQGVQSLCGTAQCRR